MIEYNHIMSQQLIPFNQQNAGKVPNLCLDNVRRGYGISNKYASAWEAWEHTEQHTDRDIPNGLDVPLYYSYTTTIDGVTENYGHINVRLANGTVWSDGNIYASIDAYTANHYPKFVGWGESVNDFKVIEVEEDDMVEFNDGDRKNFNDILYGEDKGYHKDLVGKEYKAAVEALFGSDDFRQEQYVNAGDVTNLSNAGGWPQEQGVIGWVHKRWVYDYIMNKIKGSTTSDADATLAQIKKLLGQND